MKYLCLVNKVTPEIVATLDEVPKRSGFYNWLFLFKGQIAGYDSVIEGTTNLEDFDVVHMNMPPVDQIIVPEIRKKLGWDSSTKLVLNNDHVPDVWNKFVIHPQQYWSVQEMGDMVFGTEPHQVSHMIPRTKCIPHPTNTNYLKHFAPQEKFDDGFGVIYHWWEGKTYSPSIFSMKLKKEFPNMKSKIYAYRQDVDESSRWHKVMWDEEVPPMNFPEYIEHLMANNFVYEPTSCHTYGRNSVDLACLGTPMIGSDTVFSMKHCFPKTSNDPFRIDKSIEVAKKIINNDKFREEVVEYAKEAAEYFNYKNSKERFLQALEESEKDEKEWKGI